LQEFNNYFELVCQPNSVDANLGFSEEVEQVVQLLLTNPRDALHHNKQQNFKTLM